MLGRLGARVRLVRTAPDCEGLQGLVIPGGESTVLDKLSRIFGVRDALCDAIAGGLPVLGTCAGLIMLADTILDAAPGQEPFGGLDIAVRRNAFGSQNESFDIALDVPTVSPTPVPVSFIRGPVVERVGAAATPLAALPDGRVVAVAQGSLLGLAFHPEITGDVTFHRYFLDRLDDHRYTEDQIVYS